jgi:EamA-like transporter family
VAALFANAVPYLLFAVAEQSVDSSTAGIINATTPLWTVVLAVAVRHQKSVTGWQGAGLAVVSAVPCSSSRGGTPRPAWPRYAASYIYMDKFLARRGMSPITLSAC